jgi:uncharacterized protein YggE
MTPGRFRRKRPDPFLVTIPRFTMLRSLRFLPVCLAILAASGSAHAQQDNSSSDTRSIVVSGTAEMRLVPDEALFLLTIESKDLGIDTAIARNEALWVKLQALAGEMGIGRDQIVYDNLDIEPEYLHEGPEYSIGRNTRGSYKGRDPELHDFYARRHVAITLRDLSRYTEFLARVLKLGVDLGAAPVMRHSKFDTYREQMRRQAVANARERAIAMAREIGAEIGEPISISEAGWGESRGGGGGMDDIYAMAAMYSGKNIPGQLLVTSTVNVFFELK